MWFTRPIVRSWAFSRRHAVHLFAATAFSLCIGACSHAPASTGGPVRVLYLSQSVGFVHETVRRPPGGLAPSEIALQAMARDSGEFTVELSQDARGLTAHKLSSIDVLIFSTTGALPIDRETWTAITSWVESGRGGFIGIHSAADTALDFEGGEEAYTDFLGGRFDGHPWTQGTAIGLANPDPSHPLAAMWPDRTAFAEEIYQYVGFKPDRVRVLQALDVTAGSLRRPYPVPITWIRRIGEGRLFYTNLGHTLSTWDDPRFRTQIVEAIRWTGRRMEALAAPNPSVQDTTAVEAFLAVEGLPPRSALTRPAEIATEIRGLQTLHPDKRDGDGSAWDAARQRIRDQLIK